MVNYVKKFFDFIQRQNVYRASKLTFKKIFPETSFVYLSQSLLISKMHVRLKILYTLS